VISTIPLNSFINRLDPLPPTEILTSAGHLDYRALVVLGMLTEKQNVLNCGYLYMLNRPYNRISELNEFSPYTSKSGENIILIEIPCLRDSAAWKADKKELFDMCIGSLSEDGFLSPGDVKRLFMVKSPAAYPIYRQDYAEHLQCVQTYLQTRPTLATLGRCGEFMYMDIDKCLERAFAFVDSLSDE
jgi:protoporphyrinogen oxidase